METYLIAGLGNPDRKYEETRHNAGFMALDALASKLGVKTDGKKFRGLYGQAVAGGVKLLLLKPQTYMNLSGESVAAAAAYFGIAPDHIVVISDDVNLPCGRLRIRSKGSAGGHNGLKNIILNLGSDEFARVRIGVGDSAGRDMISHVLGRFEGDDRIIMEKMYEKAAEAALSIAEHGVAETMNRFNGIDLANV